MSKYFISVISGGVSLFSVVLFAVSFAASPSGRVAIPLALACGLVFYWFARITELSVTDDEPEDVVTDCDTGQTASE
jgi:hypothetical protein